MPKNTTEKKECCRKCWKRLGITQEYPIWERANPDCDCHTTTENGWEKEFDEQFVVRGFRPIGEVTLTREQFNDHLNDIKAFIQQIAKEEYERGRKEERERAGQIAHYWSIEIAPEVSAQADINCDDESIRVFRTACEYLEGEIRAGKPAPYEKEAALETPNDQSHD